MSIRVLGIETSCDETAAAVLDVATDTLHIRADKVASQIDLHRRYGGVVPELASREHLRALPLMVEAALRDAAISIADCDLISVTSGPGLKGCLLVGAEYARGLAAAARKPFIEVNHIEAHVQAARLCRPQPELPFIALVASGGHTELMVVRGLGRYEILARTIDDAAGEAFDKAATLLNLPYPGGPSLSALARKSTPPGRDEAYQRLPQVMRDQAMFSFSGLKTAIALLVRKENETLAGNETAQANLAWAIQESIVQALVGKIERAVERTGITRVFITGGVAANSRLRERVGALPGVSAYFPEMRFCVDNAVMVAALGGARFLAGERSSLKGEVYSRWPLEECLPPGEN